MVTQSRNLITVVLTVFLTVACFSTNAFAARTTVTVTNDTPYALDVIYKAVGCVGIKYDGVQVYTPEVCKVIENVLPGATVSYEFGGGTSGRKVWAEIVSATCAGPTCTTTPQMMISTGQTWIDNWNSIYLDSNGVGHHAMIRDGFAESNYSLGDNYTNSCAVKGFGILHDAHVTWTKLVIQGEFLDFYRYQFVGDCGAVVEQPKAVFVSLGECETLVRNRPIDSNGTLLQQVVGVKADNCTANAKNHGQVVSCITQELNTLVKDNVITGAEKGALTACAAHAHEGY